jgi:ParB family chromosome partitioning protein
LASSLPPEVIEAFPSPLGLQFQWGAALKAAIDKNPDDVLAQAREFGAMTPTRRQGSPRTTHGRGRLD